MDFRLIPMDPGNFRLTPVDWESKLTGSYISKTQAFPWRLRFKTYQVPGWTDSRLRPVPRKEACVSTHRPSLQTTPTGPSYRYRSSYRPEPNDLAQALCPAQEGSLSFTQSNSGQCLGGKKDAFQLSWTKRKTRANLYLFIYILILFFREISLAFC
jgi:hypothetical protein